MKLNIPDELLEILREIKKEDKSVEEWQEIESDDMFSTENFTGGFDSLENAFCFSYYDSERKEYWFQLTLKEVENILDKKVTQINIRPADF